MVKRLTSTDVIQTVKEMDECFELAKQTSVNKEIGYDIFDKNNSLIRRKFCKICHNPNFRVMTFEFGDKEMISCSIPNYKPTHESIHCGSIKERSTLSTLSHGRLTSFSSTVNGDNIKTIIGLEYYDNDSNEIELKYYYNIVDDYHIRKELWVLIKNLDNGLIQKTFKSIIRGVDRSLDSSKIVVFLYKDDFISLLSYKEQGKELAYPSKPKSIDSIGMFALNRSSLKHISGELEKGLI